jgi:hypothetical protein
VRDFNLYEKFSSLTPLWPNNENNDPNGYNPMECFVHFDSHGKNLPCNDILKLKQIQHGKEMVNLQIKMWVESTLEFPFMLMPDEVKEFTEDYPSWVYESYIRQLKKLFIIKQGFVPSFLLTNS